MLDDQNLEATIVDHEADMRIDFARGLSIWLMLLDHITHDAIYPATLQNFGWIGAAELFAFASGYGVALTFGSMLLQRGYVIAASRILKRVWQLYAAHLVLFVIYIEAISWVAERYGDTDIFQEYHITGILSSPVQVLVQGLFLQAHPLNLELLQLAIMMLAVFPLLLASLVRWPRLTMLGSAALYVAARQFDLDLFSDPSGGAAGFNAFCWQVLFVLGAFMALYGRKFVLVLQKRRLLRFLAMGYLTWALFTAPGWRNSVQSVFGDLDPVRVTNLICIVFLFCCFVPAKWGGFHSYLFKPICKCGEEWLACFCVGIFLALAARVVLIASSSAVILQPIVIAVSFALMTATSSYVSWSRQQDQISRRSPRKGD